MKRRTPKEPHSPPAAVSVVHHSRWHDMQANVLLDPQDVPMALAREFVHQLNNPSFPTVESILQAPPDMCIHWFGEVTAKGRLVFPVKRLLLAEADYEFGYATSTRKKAQPNAARVSFFIFNDIIHNEHLVCRMCDTKSCIHPMHLEQIPGRKGPGERKQ